MTNRVVVTKLIIAIAAAALFAPGPLLAKGCIRGAITGRGGGTSRSSSCHRRSGRGMRRWSFLVQAQGCSGGTVCTNDHQDSDGARHTLKSILQASVDFKAEPG